MKQGWVLWFVGLPGAGKSAIAQKVRESLVKKRKDAHWLQMDEMRKQWFPTPDYSEEEREEAYNRLVQEALVLADMEMNVLLDGTAYKQAIRQKARDTFDRFAEVYVECSLETAMKREAARPEGHVKADLYRKAIQRKETGEQFEGLGPMIGVDVPFEADENAEIVISSETMSVEDAATHIIEWLEEKAWLV